MNDLIIIKTTAIDKTFQQQKLCVIMVHAPHVPKESVRQAFHLLQEIL